MNDEALLGRAQEARSGGQQSFEAYVWYAAASADGSSPAQGKMSAIGATLTEAQRRQIGTLVERRKLAASAAAAPPARSARGKAAAAATALLVLAALAAAGWKFHKRTRSSGAPDGAGRATGFGYLDEPALLRAAEDANACEKVVRSYLGAGKAGELTAQKPGRTPKYYGAYGRAFLKLRDLAGAITLLELIAFPGAGDETLVWTLQKAIVDQGGAKEWSWNARLSTAIDLSMQGLHDEALSLVDDEMLKETAGNISAAARVAGLYAAAKRPPPRGYP